MNDYKLHKRAKRIASKTTSKKLQNDISGNYVYKEGRKEFNPTMPKKIKVYSIRLSLVENVNKLWVNHTNYKVEECSTTLDDETITFEYNNSIYIIRPKDISNNLYRIEKELAL